MIYLDHAGTTPVPRPVADAMYEVLTDQFGNPSSQYPLGREAKQLVEGCRATVAGALGCRPENLHFTSCGTESDNWAISAAVWQGRHAGRHIITTAVEHSAVLEPCKWLQQQGYEVTYLAPDKTGQVTVQQVADALREDTVLVSMMLVNNETGCVFPVEETARLLREKKSRALLHCDAVQGFLKVPCDPVGWGVDLMSLSAHKIGGPKGVGALYTAPELRNLRPLLPGGGQEGGLRSGTEATAQIAGFARAVELRQEHLDETLRHMADIKAYCRERLLSIPGVVPVGEGTAPHIGFPGGVSQRQHRHGPGCAGHLHLLRVRLPPGQGQPCGVGPAPGQKDRRRGHPDQLRSGHLQSGHRRAVSGPSEPQKSTFSYAVRCHMFRCLKRGPGFYGYLWRLTGPIALQNLITFSLGLIDTLMVSWLGNTQMAAVTTANVPVFLLISIVFGVQSGLGILVSQYWGKKDMESISRAIGVAAMLGTGITLVLAVVLFLWPVQIMDLLSNKHELSVLGAPYLKLIGFSYVFNMLSSIYVSAMRSAENAGFGMKLFGVSTLLNTGMNYILIFGKCGFPALGIQGAAIATLLSRVAEFLICLVCALRSRILPLDLAAFFRPGWEMLRRFVKYSTPVILNETAWGLGNSLLTVILGYTDNSVEMLAANAVMGNLNRLFLVVCFGLGAATAVMVGKAIGEGQSHREVMDLSRTLLVFTLLVGTGLAAVSLALVPTLFVPVVFPLFKLTGQSAAIAAALAVTSFVMIPLHAYSISAVTGVLRAGGDVAWSAALDIAPQWLLALPLTALLALVFKANYWFIAAAIQAESLLKVPLCALRIRTGKWIHDVTLPQGEL